MVKIITDSSCDIDLVTAAQMGLEVIPIQVHFGECSYLPGINLSNDEFYEKLGQADKLPTTTQITPHTFEECFGHHLKNGDEIVGLFISKELSGTYQSALIAKEALGSDAPIHIVNTLNTTFGLALLLQEAVKLRDAGSSAMEIATKITALVPRLCLYAAVETLRYLKMGGRLSAGAAIVAGILGIYPVISVVDGKVVAVGKARGRAAANQFMLDKVKKAGISLDYCVSFGNSAVPEIGKQTQKLFAELTGKRTSIHCQIGSIIGTHVGPGASGIAFIHK